MIPSPYRDSGGREAGRRRRSLFADRDLLIPLAFFWVVSAFRVARAILDHETFGTSATLALVAVLVIPVALGQPLFARGRR